MKWLQNVKVQCFSNNLQIDPSIPHDVLCIMDLIMTKRRREASQEVNYEREWNKVWSFTMVSFYFDWSINWALNLLLHLDKIWRREEWSREMTFESEISVRLKNTFHHFAVTKTRHNCINKDVNNKDHEFERVRNFNYQFTLP